MARRRKVAKAEGEIKEEVDNSEVLGPVESSSTAAPAVAAMAQMVAVPLSAKMVWQLQDKTGWTPYSPEVTDILTAAAIAAKKTVWLSAGARTRLTVDLVNMRQEAARGGHKEVRCLIETPDGAVSWEVEVDGEWRSLQPGVAAKLDQVVDISSEVTVGGHKYDLLRMIRAGSSGEEKVRREKQDSGKYKKSGITGKIGPSESQPEEEEDQEVDEPDVSPLKKANKSGDQKKSGKKSQKKKSGKNGGTAEDMEEEEDVKPVLKSVIKKGVAPVDPDCPYREQFHVFCEGRTIWDCMLNQTNIQNNNNKYYLIQLLRSDKGTSYAVWMRWGRVGYKGQNSWTVCHNNLDSAKGIFTKKFADKTRNDWSSRDCFEKVAGKYDLVQLDYTAGSSSSAVDQTDSPATQPAVKKENTSGQAPAPESQLEQAVQNLISLICDVKTMEQSVVEMEYDTKKAPLGKITTEQIRAGYLALKDISDCISAGKTSGPDITQACNDFYTRIPHDFGFRVPPVIRTHEAVKKKLSLLETLADIQVALKILSANTDVDLSPVDRHYNQLGVDIHHLDKESEERTAIERSIQSTHAPTHSGYTMEILDVFQLNKEVEDKQFKDVGNRKLLYHGSRLSNWAGILGQGLKVAPPEAPTTGYMFGKGVYFADMASKSANYCFTNRTNNIGLLLISEVSLGQQHKLVDADYHADKLPPGHHSVLGRGKMEPSCVVELPTGLQLPGGSPRTTAVENKKGYTLQYNEYVVYDVKQIKMRYLAKIKFNHKF